MANTSPHLTPGVVEGGWCLEVRVDLPVAAEPSREGGAGRKGFEVELSTAGVVQARGKREPTRFSRRGREDTAAQG